MNRGIRPHDLTPIGDQGVPLAPPPARSSSGAGARTRMGGKRFYNLTTQGDVLLQALREAERTPGGLVHHLGANAIAIERGPGPTTVDVLLVAGEPMFWARVRPASIELFGTWFGQSYRRTIDVSPDTLRALQEHLW
jgi:hypothetical protein